jgi:hypothetical protein
MTDWSPTGAPFAISERASTSPRLEPAYRRLVRCYPGSFRRENTEEIIAVLLATAREGQLRPTVMEAADLLRGAVRMRLGLSGCPRTVLYAVRLMYLGALAEVGVLVTMLVSLSAVQAAARAAAVHTLGPHPDPVAAQQSLAGAAAVRGIDLTSDIGVTLAAIAGWLFLAWANGRGFTEGRPGAIIACGFYTATLGLAIARGDLTGAPVVIIASCVPIAIGVAANVLLLMKQSWPYYDRPVTAH